METRVTRSKSCRVPEKKILEENVSKSPQKRPIRPKNESPKENKEDFEPALTPSPTDRVGLAKKALHTSIPSALPCMVTEISFIHQFVLHLTEKTSGRLYISGSPGTGKTAVVHHVLDQLMGSTSNGSNSPFLKIFINCMNLGTPAQMFDHIAAELRWGKVSGSDLKEKIGATFTAKTGKIM
jgi:origin recognition complex subunit 1